MQDKNVYGCSAEGHVSHMYSDRMSSCLLYTSLEKEQRKLNKRLAELDRLFSSLYEDKVMERITERNFEMMSGK